MICFSGIKCSSSWDDFFRWMDETKEMRDDEVANDVAHVERVVYRRIDTFVTFLYQRELADD